MKEQLPSPEFDAGQYARPNQKWICGAAAAGKACRIGPDGRGRCRAVAECQPILDVKEGETKGRYLCRRPAEHGGPCEKGPLPDGRCCLPIPKCAPVRSLRTRRRLFTISVAAFTAGVLLVGLCGPFRSTLINPGEISAQHGSAAFVKMAGMKGKSSENCAACHRYAGAGLFGWLRAASFARPGPLEFRSLASSHEVDMSSIDQNCENCHAGHSFHQPNVSRAISCSACHREHEGPGAIAPPEDANCLKCHANADEMEASYQKGRALPPEAFDYRPEQGRVLFKTPRPEHGHTQVIHSFAADHPQFQLLAASLKDPDTLKFNHQLHLTSSTVALPGGQKLVCADCHRPDAAGTFYLKISYEENCKKCHALQFDAWNPGLVLPHGDAGHTRDFLRSLPEHYADYARHNKGLTGRREIEEFVHEQMKNIAAENGSDKELEQRIFFSDARTGPVAKIGRRDPVGAARFPGCAYCHEVTASATEAPIVTRPVIPDRWLFRGRFDHGKHFKVACANCHDALHSRETSDIILPSKDTCANCHSPQGGVAHDCATCHSYHSLRKETFAAR
jgi:hypothetical protein